MCPPVPGATGLKRSSGGGHATASAPLRSRGSGTIWSGLQPTPERRRALLTWKFTQPNRNRARTWSPTRPGRAEYRARISSGPTGRARSLHAAQQGPRNGGKGPGSPPRTSAYAWDRAGPVPTRVPATDPQPSLPPPSRRRGLSLPGQAPKQELDGLRGRAGLPVYPAGPGTRRGRHRRSGALGSGSCARAAPLAPKVTPRAQQGRGRAHAPPALGAGPSWKPAQARGAKAAGSKEVPEAGLRGGVAGRGVAGLGSQNPHFSLNWTRGETV